jgi:hypothetical protein
MKRRRRFRLSCATCGGGCLGVFALFFMVAGIWYWSVGHYQPKVLPLPILSVPNGFDDYVAAGRMLHANGGTEEKYAKNAKGIHVLSLPGEQSVVAKNQDVLARVRQAFRKSCIVPTTRSIADTFDYLSDARDLARLLAAEADVKAAQGDYAGAFSDTLDSIQMGQDLSRGGIFHHGRFGLWVEAMAHNAMLKYIDRLPAFGCDHLANRYENLLKTRVSFTQILQEDGDFLLESLAKAKTDEMVYLVFPRFGNDGGEPDGYDKLTARVFWHYLRDRTLHDLEEYYKKQVLEARKPYSERQPVPMPYSPIAARFALGPVEASDNFDETDTRSRLFLLLLRIRSYHLRQGHLPATLDVLGIDPSLTKDPFSETSLIYIPQGADYLLYSVGLDLKDDGGVPTNAKSQTKPPIGDLGVRDFQFDTSGNQSQWLYRLVPHMKPPVLPPGAPPLYP